MPQPYKTLASIAILIVLLALALFYLYNNFHEFKQLSLKNVYLLVPLIIIFLINYFFIGLANVFILKPINVNLKFLEGFQLAIITGFYNLITPFRGGMVAKAFYLNKKHDFPYTYFLSTIAASYVLIFLIAGISGLITSYLIYNSIGKISLIILGIFLTATISMLGIIFFSPSLNETKYSLINRVIRVVNGWNLIKKNKKTIFLVTLLSLSQLLLSALMLYLQFKVFGIQISYTSSLFLASLGSLAIIIAITPAGLGIQEAITVFSALTLGISPAESLAAVLIGRVISMLVLFILGPIFSVILIKKKWL